MDSQSRTFQVASVAGLSSGHYVIIDNETMAIYSVVSTGNLITVAPRGFAGTSAVPHKSGTMVLGGSAQAFIAYDPSGSCSNGSGLFQYSPVINTGPATSGCVRVSLGRWFPGTVTRPCLRV